MRPQPERLDLIPAADPAVLRRWGVSDCSRVDLASLTDSLARLQHDEVAPPSGVDRLVRHIRDRYHHTLTAVLGDAIALATACEAVHGRDDLWPHGLSDRLIETLDALQHHQQREDSVVFPLLLADRARAAEAVALMEAEHAGIRARLDGVLVATGGFRAPPQACVSWRLLYVLCCKVDVDAREQIRLEEDELFRELSGNLRRSGFVRPQCSNGHED